MTTLLQSYRLPSIDVVRGLVIVIMALDHTRDLLHTTSMTHDPLDLSTTTPALFLTRWITHFCAPVFVFLAGTSAYLMLQGRNNLPKTRKFLFTRGIWLVMLEVTLVGFGIWGDPLFRTILLQVMFAIGAGFIILSGMLKLPSRVIGIAGVSIILLHDLLPAAPFSEGPAKAVYSVFFQRGFFNLSPDRVLMVAYPIVPWLGIMLAGFGFGEVFGLEAELRRKRLFVLAAGAFFLFFGLRYTNVYGDARGWSRMDSGLDTLFSFIDVSKYPPSLLYTAMTLSVMFLLLAVAEGVFNPLTAFFAVYGRVPMFFYLVHWYVIHVSMIVMLFLQGRGWEDISPGPFSFGRPAEGVGVELPYVHLYWLSLIVMMYFPCRWYGRLKAIRKDLKWLAYF